MAARMLLCGFLAVVRLLLTEVKQHHFQILMIFWPLDIVWDFFLLLKTVILYDERVFHCVQGLLKHSAPRKRESVGEVFLSGAGHRSIMAPDYSHVSWAEESPSTTSHTNTTHPHTLKRDPQIFLLMYECGRVTISVEFVTLWLQLFLASAKTNPAKSTLHIRFCWKIPSFRPVHWSPAVVFLFSPPLCSSSSLPPCLCQIRSDPQCRSLHCLGCLRLRAGHVNTVAFRDRGRTQLADRDRVKERNRENGCGNKKNLN